MARFSASTAYYLAAATFLGAVATPVSMDFAATRLIGSTPELMAQAGSSTAMQSQIEQRVKNQQNMNALDDLTSYEQITETHAEGVKRLVPAFQALFDSMSPGQKKNADMVFARYGRQMAAKNGMSRTRANGTTKPQTQTQ